jgi:hypothetical protein
LAAVQISAAAGSPQPFLSIVYGARTANLNADSASKGFVQSNPFTQNVIAGSRDDDVLDHDYTGSDHPANIPYNMSYITHSPSGGGDLPNETEDSNGFILPSATSNGLKRAVIAELPLRPIASLVELTNWDARLENPAPPFGFNIIGNSDASPLIPSDSVVGNNIPSDDINLQHDDSYCANHVLFDDWFVSSIAPDPEDNRDQEEVYEDFLLGEEPLTNRAYRPLPEDRAAAQEAGSAANLYDGLVDVEDGWQSIASRLEVEGMFNVNSTSVQAWRALLGHARNVEVPHFVGMNSTGLSGSTDYAFSRFPVAGDSEAGTSGISGGDPPLPEATQFTGYRVYDDDFLDSLAEELVEQVRDRGPFLSLAEFVNRQLESEGTTGEISDANLALAGAIQTALNEVTSSNNTFSDLQTLSAESQADPAGEEEYQYSTAAAGSSAYGLPGWTRQADVLRPIAPILSARDDTFTIRAYGDVRDQTDNVTAKAYCEAVVRRTREYVDPSDPAFSPEGPQLPENQQFGRQFEIVSFRWLEPEDV